MERLPEISLGIVQNNSNEVLIVQRKKIEKGKGDSKLSWAFPGGKVEEKESKETAVEREVFEETGYRVEAIEVISERQHPQFPVYIYYLECVLLVDEQIGEPTDEEVIDVVWVSPGELYDYFTSNLDSKVAAFITI